MKKYIIALLFVCSVMMYPFQAGAALNESTVIDSNQDSEQLRLQDMLMMFLIPYIYEDVGSIYYPDILKIKPVIEAWKINIITAKRLNGFRGFILEITLEVEPTLDHHVPVGKDRLTYRISYGPSVQFISSKHLETYILPNDLQQFKANNATRNIKGALKDNVIKLKRVPNI